MPFRRMPGLIYALIFALSGMVSSGCAAATQPAPQDVIAIVNGVLIDGTGAGPVPEAVLLISDERILAVGKKAEIRIPPGRR